MTCLPLTVRFFSYATRAAIESLTGIWHCHALPMAKFTHWGVEMLPKSMLALAVAAVTATTLAVPAGMAAETGLAAMHALRREGGRLCMSDHWHYGSSGAQSTKAAAQRAAIRSWQDFTDLEYGSSWARFSRAASRRMGCSRSAAGWTCDAEGRPCR